MSVRIDTQARKKRLRVACFDGDGVQCFSQLMIMRCIMHSLRWEMYGGDSNEIMKPSDHFDMMGGCGAGGLIVLMFVVLQMSVEEAIKEFGKIIEEVYLGNLTPEERTARLANCMKTLLKTKGLPLDLQLEKSDDGCAGFIVASLCLTPNVVDCFRTYSVRDEPPSVDNITVVDAALATCASPGFAAVPLPSGGVSQDYARVNFVELNPIRHVITEACALFREDSTVALLLSLGAGGYRNFLVTSDSPKDEPPQPSLETRSICQQRTQEIQNQLRWAPIYFRFSNESVLRGSLTQLEPLRVIAAHTNGYLKQSETKAQLNQCVNSISASDEVEVTLKQLGQAVGTISMSEVPSLIQRLPLAVLNQHRGGPPSQDGVQPPASDQVTKVSSNTASSPPSTRKLKRWWSRIKPKRKPSAVDRPPNLNRMPARDQQYLDASSYTSNKKGPPESMASTGAPAIFQVI